MTIHNPATHTPRHDTATHLADAMAIMTAIGLEARLAAVRPPKSNRGAKPRLGQYTAVGIACAMYELVATGKDFTVKEILDALWFRLTDEQMVFIGLAALRSKARVAGMRPRPGATRADMQKAKKLYQAEYQRLWQAMQRLFAPMDDTPLVANHTARNRPTVKEVETAAADPALAAKRALMLEVVNAIIAGGLHIENQKRHPDKTIHNGVLADHEGHIAIDETHLEVGSWGNLKKDKAPGNFRARPHAHHRTLKGAPALIGLTLSVAVARPDQPNDVPGVCVGASIHHPTGGLGSAVIDIVDAIDANNLRATQGSNRSQYVIVDGGYTRARDLNRQLHNRKYGMVMEYAEDQRIVHEVGAIRNDDGTRTPGIVMYAGRPLCPGVNRRELERLKLELPDRRRTRNADGSLSVVRDTDNTDDEDIDDDTDETRVYDGAELVAHDKTLEKVLPFVMSTNGRPTETTNRTRGGQRKNHTAPEPVMAVTLVCPHKKGTALCPLFPEYYDDNAPELPRVPNAPVDLPNEQRPSCCQNTMARARIPMPEFKNWQDFMPGTWEHRDWYTGPRSANERYNNNIKRANGGGPGLDRGRIAPRKSAPFALFTAMSIANANRIILESWTAKLTLTGHPPKVKAATNKAEREQALRLHRNKGNMRRRAG